MKKAIAIILILIGFTLALYFSYWAGYQGARFEQKNQVGPIETTLSGDQYTKYMLKNCLLERQSK